jgi:hypothetical protein
VLHRVDGVDVAFEGGAYNAIGGRVGEVPHDLAHLVVEDELGLRQGVWGVLAAGGLFRHATVVAGRQAPHAARRGRALVERAGDRLTQAEILTRVVCDAVAGRVAGDERTLRAAVGERWWCDALTTVLLDRAGERLHAAGERWARLEPDAALTEYWPH